MGALKSGGALIASALLLATALLPATAARPAPQGRGEAGSGKSDAHRALGTFSCSARGCHGGASPVSEAASRITRSEVTTWVRHDKHADAYNVLLNARSKAIASRLGLGQPAHKSTECLACHATPSAASSPGSPLLSEGVGCEACHGPASDWIEPHVRRGWHEKSSADKLALGMTPTESPADRVAMCAGCHVGAPAADGLPSRDVNHDLIAAGHPRLAFEFSWFQAMMPRHWRERSDPADAARAWAIGQLEVAATALRLLSDRAAGADRPWPEFAEFDCFACHHDLLPESWRRRHSYYSDRTPGAPPWATWTTALLPEVLDDSSPLGLADGPQLIDGLRALRGHMSRPNPARAEAADQASRLADQLDSAARSIKGTTLSEPVIQGWMRSFLADPRGDSTPSWARDTQRLMAAEALYRALYGRSGPERDAGLAATLKARRDALGFEPTTNSPMDYSPLGSSPGVGTRPSR